MNAVVSGDVQRISPRLTPRGGCKVACQKGTLGLGADLAVQLLDVSLDGAGLTIREALPVGTEVSLILEGPGNARAVKRTAAVRSCEPADGKNHRIGVAFQKRLERVEIMSLT
jgi:hypothetical protein